MDDMKKNIRRVFWLYFLLFLITIGYLGNFIIFESEKVITNSYNRRLIALDQSIKRGNIFSSNGEILAYSEISDDLFVRRYPFGETFSHVVGYSGRGSAGIESRYNFELQRLTNEVIQRISHSIGGKDLYGNSLVLTIDSDLQRMIYEEFPVEKGAVVVTEPSTGKILSMVSFPSFDPNGIFENWSTLNSDNQNIPLLNRATQALYPPGSTFKMLTALAAIENNADIEDFYYECEGEVYFEENRVRCFDSTAHGILNLKRALEVSCNTYFAHIGLELTDELREVAERVYFNNNLDFELTLSRSLFLLDEYSTLQKKVQTSFGQGDTLVTPLHTAMLTGAIANGGFMMQPYILDSVVTESGRVRRKNMPVMLEQVLQFEHTEILREMMTGVVDNGTAAPIKIAQLNIAGKTGTAQNETGLDHSWFVAFAPAENPQICVSIVLESSGGGGLSMALAKKIIEHALLS